MSTKKNKIIQNAPVGYYVVDYTSTQGLIKTPIVSFVFYFDNSQNDSEIITTNYLTINNSGFDKCSRKSSNYNYIMHPDGLIYSVNNNLNWQPMTEDKFISEKKLNYTKNIDNQINTNYNDYVDCYTLHTPSNYSDYLQKYDTTTDTSTINNYSSSLNFDYENDYSQEKYNQFNKNNSSSNILHLPNYDNFNYNYNIPSHINFSDNNQIIKFNNKEEAGEYCLNNAYSTLNNNIYIDGEYYNCTCYKDYVYFFNNDANEKTFRYGFNINY